MIKRTGGKVWGPESAQWQPLSIRGLLGLRVPWGQGRDKAGGALRGRSQWVRGWSGRHWEAWVPGSSSRWPSRFPVLRVRGQRRAQEAPRPDVLCRTELRRRSQCPWSQAANNQMTGPCCGSSTFLNLIFSPYSEGGPMPLPTTLGLSHILEGCTCLSGSQPLLAQLNGRKGALCCLISSICLPHWNVGSTDQDLLSVHGLESAWCIVGA